MAADFENRYGTFDRLLHRLAFATRSAQLGIADLEDKQFKDELAAFEPGAPVFVTSLPRAGTTILLELLAGLPDFATHTYRDMPFVLCPMLWRRFSGKRKAGDKRERAHGDGIEVSLDSPEAFEEMVWLAFFAKRYRDDRLTPWGSLEGEREFLEFFAAHRRKIIALRRRAEPRATRYLSKNNLNVARLPALLDAIPGARAVVPVRDPLQHARSLHNQHLRFTEMHAQDSFARRYMAGIGHFDFGANLKPIDFGGWLGEREGPGPEHLQFWLEYWLAWAEAMQPLRGDPRVQMIPFEAMGTPEVLDRLAGHLGILNPADLRIRAAILETRPAREFRETDVPREMFLRARALHFALTTRGD